MEISKELAELASNLLELASDEFSNHGCNDHYVEDTPRYRKLVQEMETNSNGEENELRFSEGKILGNNHVLMSEAAEIFKKYANL